METPVTDGAIPSSESDGVSNNNDSIIITPEPIIIRGNGNFTLFGLSNSYPIEFPPKLKSRLAPEEYTETIFKVNKILKKMLAHNFRWLIFGCICCCCTAGCSLLPVVCLNKRVLQSINKLLDWENNRLYFRLGFSWKIEQQRFEHFNEYVLVLEELPKFHVYKPD